MWMLRFFDLYVINIFITIRFLYKAYRINEVILEYY